jgi:hypothetical protein
VGLLDVTRGSLADIFLLGRYPQDLFLGDSQLGTQAHGLVGPGAGTQSLPLGLASRLIRF